MSERTTFVRAAYAVMMAGGGEVMDGMGANIRVYATGETENFGGYAISGNDWLPVPDRAPRDDVARMAAELSEANARIVKLEEENILLKKHARGMKERIDELEAAAQWHPASEPPKLYAEEYLLLNLENGEYWQEVDRWNKRSPECVGWRDLPPVKGSEA